MSVKHALIIANTEYTDPGLARLSAPGKDAEEFARVLQSPDICAFDHVQTLLNPSESAARTAIDLLFDEKRPDDLLLLYFSGHGVRDEQGALYLAVQNTDHLHLRATAVKSDFVRECMGQSRSKRQVLILDCCNSGAFAQGTKAAAGGSLGTAAAFEGTGYGHIVLTASDATQFAWEGEKVIGATQNSLFTHFLIKGLEGDADCNGDGRITVDELYDYAYEQIVSLTPKQTPSKWSYKEQGEIILREITQMEDIRPVSLPAALRDALENPFPDVRLGAVQQLGKMLSGGNLGMARSARAALEKLASGDDSYRVRQAAARFLPQVPRGASPAEDKQPAAHKRRKSQRLGTQRSEAKAATTEKTGVEQERAAQHRAGTNAPARGRMFAGHTKAVLSVAFSPDGKCLAAGDYDGAIILWDAATGQRIGEPLRGHTSWVNSVAFSPDGKTLASGSGDKTILLWDAATHRPTGQPLIGHTEYVSSVAFSPDGKMLASGSYDKTVGLWDVSTGRLIGQRLSGHVEYVSSVAFSPDGGTLASGDGSIFLWVVATRRRKGRALMGHLGQVLSVAFSPDGRTLASGGYDKSICLWDMSTGQSIGRPLEGHTDVVMSVAFSPDGKVLASGSADNTIMLWDLTTRQRIGEPLRGHTSSVNSVAFSPDGRTLASGSRDKTIILW